MLTTDQKGNIAEQAVTFAAIRLGLQVYRPVGEGGRYDLIFDLGSRLLRVQCKWARRNRDVISVGCFSCRRTREGQRRRLYTEAEIDAIAAYCPDLNRCYLLPAGWLDGRQRIYLRLEPAKNGQQTAVNWAHSFEFAAVDWFAVEQTGAIAQLEEHLAGSEGVVGSSPTSSITDASFYSRPVERTCEPAVVTSEVLRDRLGTYLALARGGTEVLVTRRGKAHARLTPP